MPRRHVRMLFRCVMMLTFLARCPYLAGQDRKYEATVHLKIVAVDGSDLGRAKVAMFKKKFVQLSSDREMASRFKNNSIDQVPFGTYRLKVYATGFYETEREVQVFAPEVWVVVQLQVGEEVGTLGLPTFTLPGKVICSGEGSEPLWLRMTGVYSSVVIDAKIPESGEFQVVGIPQGEYVLIARQGTRIAHTLTFRVPTSTPVIIDLSSANIGCPVNSTQSPRKSDTVTHPTSLTSNLTSLPTSRRTQSSCAESGRRRACPGL